MPLRSMAHGGQWRPGDAGTTGTEPGRLQRDLQCRPPTQTMTVEDVSGPSWRGAAAAARPLRPARSRRTWRRLGSVRVSSKRTHEGQHPHPLPHPEKPRGPARHTLRTVGSPNAAAPPSPSAPPRCPTSARRRSGPRVRPGGRPRCSRPGRRPCASAATTGTRTASPRRRRWPLRAKFEKKLTLLVFGGRIFHIKHRVKSKFPREVLVFS